MSSFHRKIFISLRLEINPVNVFDQLSPDIGRMLEAHGMTEPTLPQELAIPAILSGENVLLIAPTGTGKTEAAALPLFHHILASKDRGIKALYITPLRALNRDMLRRFQEFGDFLKITVAVRHGDTTKAERARQSRKPPDLLITTPETLQVMLTGTRLRQNLSTVGMVVVDEVHELATSKRGAHLAVLMERLVEVSGEFQRIGLSATVGSPEVVASLLVGPGRSSRIIRADVKRQSRFSVVSPAPSKADAALARELECDPALASQIRFIRDAVRSRKSLIFVNTRQAAEVLGSRFKQMGDAIGIHHGSLSTEARIEAEDAFKAGALRGLICTSSMELGIDIGDVEQVIQYSSPREVSRLLQRVGRAGHGIGKTSYGTIVATCPDDIVEACAIARRAAEGALEPIEVHELPADVLANQLVGLTLDFGDIDFDRAYGVVKRSHPFRNLTREMAEEVTAQVEENRLLRREGGSMARKRKGREYYFENLSMIPDEKRYAIFDMVSRRAIGTLDEAFVVNFVQPGATFVAKGEIWEIVELDEDTIKVVPIHRSGEIPSWTGEEIPVPYEVAQEVGRIRADLAGKIEAEGEEAAAKALVQRYPLDEQAASEYVGLISRQMKARLPIPDDRHLVVEADGATVVIHACLGHKANDALARALTALLSARFGSSVAQEIDPYRIVLELPRAVYAEDVASLISGLDPTHIEPILEMTLKNTTLLRWKMVHVARKFGALSRDIDHERVSISRLLGFFEGTPMYKEALREIYHDRLDLSRARDVLERLASRELELLTSGSSPIGALSRGGGRDITSPDQPDGAVIDLLKNRIMHDRVILFCVNCKKWKSTREVSRVPDRPECPLCGSRMIAALKPWEEEEIAVVKKPENRKAAEDKRRTKRVFRNANLVLTYGKDVIIALASRGLGPETAARVIRKRRGEELEFYRDILKAEREYARTKRFWG